MDFVNSVTTSVHFKDYKALQFVMLADLREPPRPLKSQNWSLPFI